jgi:hypothetical protein
MKNVVFAVFFLIVLSCVVFAYYGKQGDIEWRFLPSTGAGTQIQGAVTVGFNSGDYPGTNFTQGIITGYFQSYDIIKEEIETINIAGTIYPNTAQFLSFNTENDCDGLIIPCSVIDYTEINVTNTGNVAYDVKLQIPTTTPFGTGSNWQLKITDGVPACNLFADYTIIANTSEVLVYKNLLPGETIKMYYQFDMYSNVSIAKQDTKTTDIITSRPASVC